ncbi:hypothetical protein [Desulfoferula mesophila]
MKRGKKQPAHHLRDAETSGSKQVMDKLNQSRGKFARGIRFIPPNLWEERCLFVGAKDNALRHLTRGEFASQAASSGKTHPIFVLQRIGNAGHRLCPCSSKRLHNQRYIEQGCRLEHTSYVIARRTYLVEECVFQVPSDPGFLWSLRYWGRVPENCLRDGS